MPSSSHAAVDDRARRRVVGLDEPADHRHERRGVGARGPVGARVRLREQAVGEHGASARGDGPPPGRWTTTAAPAGDGARPGGGRGRGPSTRRCRRRPGGGVRAAPRCPRSAGRPCRHLLGDGVHQRPPAGRELTGLAGDDADGLHQEAQGVVLHLGAGGVADPDGLRASPPLDLGDLALVGHRAGVDRPERGLQDLLRSEALEEPQVAVGDLAVTGHRGDRGAERSVAQPRVAVVPLAVGPRDLGERGGGGGEEGAGRGVGAGPQHVEAVGQPAVDGGGVGPGASHHEVLAATAAVGDPGEDVVGADVERRVGGDDQDERSVARLQRQLGDQLAVLDPERGVAGVQTPVQLADPDGAALPRRPGGVEGAEAQRVLGDHRLADGLHRAHQAGAADRCREERVARRERVRRSASSSSVSRTGAATGPGSPSSALIGPARRNRAAPPSGSSSDQSRGSSWGSGAHHQSISPSGRISAVVCPSPRTGAVDRGAWPSGAAAPDLGQVGHRAAPMPAARRRVALERPEQLLLEEPQEAGLVGADLVEVDAGVTGGDPPLDGGQDGPGVGAAHDGVGELLVGDQWRRRRELLGRGQLGQERRRQARGREPAPHGGDGLDRLVGAQHTLAG